MKGLWVDPEDRIARARGRRGASSTARRRSSGWLERKLGFVVEDRESWTSRDTQPSSSPKRPEPHSPCKTDLIFPSGSYQGAVCSTAEVHGKAPGKLQVVGREKLCVA